MAPDRAPLDDPVGAFVNRIDPAPDARPDDARGPLSGIRVAVDDLVAVAALVSGAGNPAWRRTHEPAPTTAPALQVLLDAGAALVGTTVVDEFGLGTIGINPQEGTPVNPVAPDSVPGGSASGAASAVAAGSADVALVADTTGGARIPASVCGLYGMRLTPGRVAVDGLVPRAPALDGIGVLARDAETLWRTVRLLLGSSAPADRAPDGEGPRPLDRLVLAEDLWDVADDEVVEAMLPLLQRLALRVPVEPLEQLAAATGLHAWAEAQEVLVSAGAWVQHGAWFTATNPTTSLDLKHRVDAARALDDDVVVAARARRAEIRADVRGALGADAALVLPTTPAIAPLLGDAERELRDFRDRTAMLTCVATLAGLPQVTVPFVQLAEYPVGLSIVGPAGSDERVVALAAAIARPI